MSELKSFIVLYDGKFIRAYEEKEADKAIAELKESHKKEVEQLLMKIAELEEERRWRKFPDEKPAPRKATWLEVAKWCATGNGLVYDTNRDIIDTGIMFKPDNEHEPIMDELKVRKWGDTEWHEPTVDYIGLEEK